MKYEELLDDYVNDKLPELEKTGFEQAMLHDAALRKEVELQKAIVKEIQQARIAELKAILNNVPAGAWQNTAGSTGLKAALGIVSVAALIVTGIWLFYNAETTIENNPEPASIEEEVLVEATETEAEAEETIAEAEVNEVKNIPPSAKQKSSANQQNQVKKEAQPNINIVEFDEDLTPAEEKTMPVITDTETSSLKITGIVVEIEDADARNNFHYRFSEDKLILYGSFDKSLYEVLEFNTGKSKMVFFFYKDTYYQLDPNKNKITPLEALKDQELLNRLKSYSRE
ncbi:MAG TPA: hypothetical protein PKC24_05195 [Cyclobacteriaceae bacterium]|nr:hypothetical protein [Cyclobacteriaceae bacterium]